jgi:hypothetical protein
LRCECAAVLGTNWHAIKQRRATVAFRHALRRRQFLRRWMFFVISGFALTTKYKNGYNFFL